MASSTSATREELERRLVHVTGTVQGVGFRPFVYREATALGLAGWVANGPDGVVVVLEGAHEAIEAFLSRLRHGHPPLAHLDRLEEHREEPRGERGFHIVDSSDDPHRVASLPPDVATCPDCLAELADPLDRRFRYPFITCTNCGPRYTVATGMPWDRARTTMARFALCPACRREYEDPADRRFHAEPLACSACGPTCWFIEADGRTVTGVDASLAAAAAALGEGAILALQGVGGFHLAVRADREQDVRRLRERKHRPAKPFAVMVPDLAAAAALVVLDARASAELCDPRRPIVIADRLPRAPLAPSVAPGVGTVGVLLPYSGLHALLFAEPSTPRVLVMTSGNRSDEPIAITGEEALERLAGIADAFLLHDRPIARPCDDSVLRVAQGERVLVRRSRGYAPEAISLPLDAPASLGVGADLKTVACLARGRQAWLSQHIGDLANPLAREHFLTTTRDLASFLRLEPQVVVADAHPGLESRMLAESLAEERGLDLVLVQHHHAHLATLLVEHGRGLGDRIVGIAADGTGYGADGTVWGCEVGVVGLESFERSISLRVVPLIGGDRAVMEPWRMAAVWLAEAGVDPEAYLARRGHPVRSLLSLAHTPSAAIPTSSLGRLFDAVACLLGLVDRVSYDAEAPMLLEALARTTERAFPLTIELRDGILDPCGAIADIARAMSAPSPPLAALARGFHRAVAAALAQAAARLADQWGVEDVGATGGVFQNTLLLAELRKSLDRQLRLLVAERVPPNDAGIALGQVAVAAAGGGERRAS